MPKKYFDLFTAICNYSILANFDQFTYWIMDKSAYFFKSTPLRALDVLFCYLIGMLQTY